MNPVTDELDSPGLGRMTWLGLTLATIGWAGLIVTMLGVDPFARGGRTTAPSHADLIDLAVSLIGSGFGLAIIGSLQVGFGVLNRFFLTVLARSAQRATTSVASASPDVVPSDVPITAASRFEEADVAVDRGAEPLRERRPYRILDDGSVEVETILGSRRFASMHEARDFI